jgi:transcriptional regulator with XRE-family HTH domain
MPRPRNTANKEVKAELLPIALAIQTARKRAGLTQQQLAAKLNVETSVLARYELGARSVPQARLIACSRILKDASLAGFAAEEDEGATTAKRQRNDFESPEAFASFNSRRFSSWWASRYVELIEEFDVEYSDIVRSRSLLFKCVAASMQMRALDSSSVDPEALIRIASAFLPAIKQALGDICEARAASAA